MADIPMPSPPQPEEFSAAPGLGSQSPSQQPVKEEQQPSGPPEPGPWEGLMGHTEAKNILAQSHFFSGAKCVFQRNVSDHLQASHTINLGGGEGNSYQFAPTFVGTGGSPPEQPSPILLGSIDNDGNLIARIIAQLTDVDVLKFNGQTQGRQWLGAQVELAHAGSNFTGGATFVNINPIQQSGIVVVNYLQRMTRNLALGGDFMVQKMQGRTGTAMTFGARYKADDCIATATLGTAQANFEASYFQKVNEQTAVTANLQISLAERATKTIVGWQQTLTQSIFRGQINSDGQIIAGVEYYLLPGMSFSINGMLDHSKEADNTQFGVGFSFQS